eukprot:s6406_g3.t1
MTGLLRIDKVRDSLQQAMLDLTRMQIYSVFSEAEVNVDNLISDLSFAKSQIWALVKSLRRAKSGADSSQCHKLCLSRQQRIVSVPSAPWSRDLQAAPQEALAEVGRSAKGHGSAPSEGFPFSPLRRFAAHLATGGASSPDLHKAHCSRRARSL